MARLYSEIYGTSLQCYQMAHLYNAIQWHASTLILALAHCYISTLAHWHISTLTDLPIEKFRIFAEYCGMRFCFFNI